MLDALLDTDITRRDLFAALVMQTLLKAEYSKNFPSIDVKVIACMSVDAANALCNALDKPTNEKNNL